jgi:hypothetical protein
VRIDANICRRTASPAGSYPLDRFGPGSRTATWIYLPSIGTKTGSGQMILVQPSCRAAVWAIVSATSPYLSSTGAGAGTIAADAMDRSVSIRRPAVSEGKSSIKARRVPAF